MAYIEPNASRVRPDPTQMWAGGAATAIVAALIALVGILICRWTLRIPILAPSSDGAWGSAHTGEFVLAAAIIALAATGLMHLLMLGAPRAGLFFRWILVLVTIAAAVYPFSTGAPLAQKVATAAVLVVLGIAITSLIIAVASRAARYVRVDPVDRVDRTARGDVPVRPSSDTRDDIPPYDQQAPTRYDQEAPARPTYRPTQRRR